MVKRLIDRLMRRNQEPPLKLIERSNPISMNGMVVDYRISKITVKNPSN